jgi:predicted secreted protein
MFARFALCRKGVAAVEAAFVFPILIALLIGTIEFSFVLFTNNAIQNAAREVSRQLAVNYIGLGEVEAAVVGRVPAWAADEASVSVSQSTPGDPTTNLITVSVSVPATAATPLNLFMPALGELILTTSVTMKQEAPL